jgi:hypothetical protein
MPGKFCFKFFFQVQVKNIAFERADFFFISTGTVFYILTKIPESGDSFVDQIGYSEWEFPLVRVERIGALEPVVALKVEEEIVQLLLAGAGAEVLAAGVQQHAHKTQPEHSHTQLNHHAHKEKL